MLSVRRIMAGVVAAAGLSIAASNADAQYYGYNFAPSYNVYSLDRIPHFAQFPPVYYSYPVARPYGYSPYAYPGWVQTPAVNPVHVAPVIIQNPYASFTSPPKRESLPEVIDTPKSKGVSVTPAESLQAVQPPAATPLIIKNPHIAQK